MNKQRIQRHFLRLGTTGLVSTLALVACTKDDTVTAGNTPAGTQVTSCGSLDPAQAAQLATARLEHFGTVGLAALGGLEGSRAAARLLSFGNETLIDAFVADSQSSLHDSLATLRDEQLVASNVESASGATVTFLMNAATRCKQSDSSSGVALLPAPAVGGSTGIGGASGAAGAATQLDPVCVKDQTEHPLRVRVSRIACDSGDNVAIEVLRDASQERLLLTELYADNANIELNVGAYLRAVTSSDTTSVTSNGQTVVQTTTKSVVTSAVGSVTGTLTLNGSDKASGKISVVEALDATFTDSDARLRLAAGTDVLSIVADGTARSINVTAGLGAFDWRARFVDFVDGMFQLGTNESAAAQPPVDLHLAGLRGKLDFDGKSDVIVASGLDLGGVAATAKQGSTTLLSVTAGNAQQLPIGATLTGMANDNVGLTLLDGLNVQIQYGVEPDMPALQNPANYLAKDLLSVTATTGSNLVLFKEPTSNDLVLFSSQTGSLLSMQAGTLKLQSSLWPNDAVTAVAGQCMTRNPTAVAGHHDLLDDFLIGACQ